MPRKIHPSLINEESEPFEGFPRHGEPYSESEPDEPDDDGDETDDDDEPEDSIDARFDRMNRELGQLRAENQHLRRSIPPVTEPQAPEPVEEEPDWEDLIFKDPKEAFRLHGEMVRKSVTKELRGQYEREKNTENFWQRFYRQHDDLYEDHDLVLATLNKHFSELQNMPSSAAMNELADLTRKRIMKYSGRDPGEQSMKKKRSRAVAEGAEAPKPRAPQNVVPISGSLSGLLRKRRAKRFGRGQVA